MWTWRSVSTVRKLLSSARSASCSSDAGQVAAKTNEVTTVKIDAVFIQQTPFSFYRVKYRLRGPHKAWSVLRTYAPEVIEPGPCERDEFAFTNKEAIFLPKQ